MEVFSITESILIKTYTDGIPYQILPKIEFNSFSVLTPEDIRRKSLQYELFASKAISESLKIVSF